MQVIGLIGEAGSGKSHRALFVAHDYSIPLIIDDGILLKHNQLIAGISSKRQNTKVSAIKTALFSDVDHAAEVREKIREFNPSKILVLGTSEKMILKITNRLELPAPSEFIYINQIATSEEISKAKATRKKYGKHVIPAPTVEVKSRFSGLLADPLPTFFKKKKSSEKHFMVNQTVVQPTFNFLGNFYIANLAVNQIIIISAQKVEGVKGIHNIRTRTIPEGIEINFQAVVLSGHQLPKIINKLRSYIQSNLEYMTSLNVLEINIYVKKLAENK